MPETALSPARRPAADAPITTNAADAPAGPGAVESARHGAFEHRHIGPDAAETAAMLATLGYGTLEEMLNAAVPADIRLRRPLHLPPAATEHEALELLRTIVAKNHVSRSLIGMGYHACITAPVIQRNILENPGWYTQYTPYQAEIAQGRLEALLTFQTMVADLTGLPLATASLLDEATAAAEAMALCRAAGTPDHHYFLMADNCHPQTLAVVQTRAAALGVPCRIEPAQKLAGALPGAFGVLAQYPATDGQLIDYSELITAAHAAGAAVAMAADILALTLLKPPGEFGADIAIGSTQRLGVPMGFGGPHAAYLSATAAFTRRLPGRIVGVSRDAAGKTAYRLALQTREQHIRREKATSNICTAQVLLAIIASMHAVYHGPAGLRAIAQQIHDHAVTMAEGLEARGCAVVHRHFFDTIMVRVNPAAGARPILAHARENQINLREYDNGDIGIALDELTTAAEVDRVLALFSPGRSNPSSAMGIPPALRRAGDYLKHPVFNTHHSETEMLRYLQRLQSRDLSLTTSMIPLGSCTMKLNATAEMLPITWPQLARIHPLAPAGQTQGYLEMIRQLEGFLSEITGFPGISLQPNAGSQGEFAGLLAIKAWHESRRQGHRNICLIPVSAHGTNPASAAMAGFHVAPVACDSRGNINMEDLRATAVRHAANLACMMITYPSTHGVFEQGIKEICGIVHEHGGQVYMDGANMNAMVGVCRPAEIGADVCHLNLHKTFCIPHGGGGPGVGPIGVAEHLRPYLPAHPLAKGHPHGAGPVAQAPYGSAGILAIPWMYITMMGGAGLRRATAVAMLNANYMARRLEAHYPLLFRGNNGLCAHEFILDLRPFEQSAGIKAEDVAKRLMDYGFHAPTMSWPEPGTLMIEPTESEAQCELDRFCDALISIRGEIAAVEAGRAHRVDNVLKNAPHTAAAVTADAWTHSYTRQQAAFPLPYLEADKFWPAVARIDNPYGDRNLFCACPPTG